MFEFQQQSTVHLHLLVWLHDLRLLRPDLFNASVTWSIPEEAFEVVNLQSSDRFSLPLFPWLSRVIPTATGQVFMLQHFGDDADRKLRAPITSLPSALSCRTDVQVSDGCGMLSRDVSSYVTVMM